MANIPLQVYRQLLDALGPQHWWPAQSPLEVMVGAVLVQNTSWKNVERAIENLREADLLSAHRLAPMSTEALAEVIRPAGYYRVKAKRLGKLIEFFLAEYVGSIDAMRAAETSLLREQLLGVHGIGPETADSILLYALDKPALVVDTYTHRIFARHGWIDYEADYHQLQKYLLDALPEEVRLYNELHALLVYVGHHHCRKTPKCESCPLENLLPESGIVSAEG